eukprot:gene45683-61072_t
MLHHRGLREERADNGPPLRECGRSAEPHGVGFQGLPTDHQHIALRAFDALLHLVAQEAFRLRDHRFHATPDGLVEGGLLAGGDADVCNLENHDGLLRPGSWGPQCATSGGIIPRPGARPRQEPPVNRPDDWQHDHEVGIAADAPSTLDTTRVDDVRIAAVRPLISPALLLEDLPLPAAGQALIERARAEMADVLAGRDDRLIAIVGPCSIHDHGQAMDYARRLQALAQELRGELLVVMRVYFEKPRTTVGWKGYINDPRLDGSFRINEGLRRARQLLLEVAALGLPAGTEFLDLLS